MSFDNDLLFGKVGESSIARYLRKRGATILPVYEKLIDEGKGPQLFMPDKELIAPDMLALCRGKAQWVEAKHKESFTKWRKTDSWQTGIDRKHYEHYCKVCDETPYPVWLFFLHKGGVAKGCSESSPSGLFIQNLQKLRVCVDHISPPDYFTKSGMVFWNINSLILFASFQEVAA